MKVDCKTQGEPISIIIVRGFYSEAPELIHFRFVLTYIVRIYCNVQIIQMSFDLNGHSLPIIKIIYSNLYDFFVLWSTKEVFVYTVGVNGVK